MPRTHTLAVSLALAAVLACRAVGPEHEPPTRSLAPSWSGLEGGALSSQTAELSAWWRTLGDPELDALVEEALSGGLEVRTAVERVRAARALRGASASELYPQADGSLAWRRSGESLNTPLGAFVPDTDITSIGFDATWELDLFGRVRRSLQAAGAELDASVEDARGAAVTVAAEVARSYVELRAFQRRLALARTNVELQQQTLELVSARSAAGLVGEIDVAQARTNLAATRSRVPSLEAGQHAAENRLAVLLGTAPGTLGARLATPAPIPVAPLALAVGVPADLLRRRADVRAAERRLAAATARIGMAEAELYPRLTLSGNLGLAAEDPADLLQNDSGVFGIGPSLRWNLFDGGRRRALLEVRESEARQALLAWESTVLSALEECENALTRFVREERRRAELAEGAAQARLAVELARAQYGEGLSDFQAVLVSERSLAELEDELSNSEAGVTTQLVALYKALGGGIEDGPLAASVADALAATER